MKKVIDTLKQHIKENPPNYGSADSLMDMLYWHYTEANTLDNDKIRAHFDSLRQMIPLSREEYDQVFYIVSDMCLEHGRLAFHLGLQFGVQFMLELSDP